MPARHCLAVEEPLPNQHPPPSRRGPLQHHLPRPTPHTTLAHLLLPLMMISKRGWGKLTGVIVSKCPSTRAASSRPDEPSIMSTGCSATPPKSSLMYLQHSKKTKKTNCEGGSIQQEAQPRIVAAQHTHNTNQYPTCCRASKPASAHTT